MRRSHHIGRPAGKGAGLRRRGRRAIGVLGGGIAGQPNELARERQQADHDESSEHGVRATALEGDQRGGSSRPAKSEDDVLL
jgi:hypothetical protein